jgi:hypothetical protein
MLRGAGIVALIVLAACNQSSPTVRVSPSVPAAQASWNQDLTLTGELTGHMSGIVTSTSAQFSECTGAKPRTGETWSDSFYGTIDGTGTVWGVIFLIANYGGPGGYQNAGVNVQVHSLDGLKVWENLGSDKVKFTLDRTAQSGTVDAMLTDAASGKTGAVHLTGTWNCQP